MRTLAEQLARLQRIEPLLQCPQCAGPLMRDEGAYVSRGCGQRYPIESGIPILLPQEMRSQGLGRPLSFDEHASTHPYSPASEELIAQFSSGWVLDLGAGGKQTDHANVIQMDVFRFPHTDIVGSADCLPFRSSVFDAVVSQAVFEHLQYPEAAAAEIWRTLKPDGVTKVDTAFLQPEHAYPHHYFNATEAGLKHWFRDFELAWSGVEFYQQPQWALLWFLDVYLAALPPEPQRLVGEQTLAQCVAALKRLQAGQPAPGDNALGSALISLAPDSVRKLAAGVSVRAIKRLDGTHVARPRDAASLSTQLGLERRLEVLTVQSQEHQAHLLALTELQQIAADRTRFLVHEYKLMRLDPIVNPGFVRPLFGLLVREVRRRVPASLWQRFRQSYHERRAHAARPVSAESPPAAALTFMVEPDSVVSLLDQFFSLTRQTHAGWALWVFEPAGTSVQLQRLMWELAHMDARVSVVKSGRSSASILQTPWVKLRPNSVLAFDAVMELVTLVQQQPWVTHVSADVQAWSADLRQPMRCWGLIAQDAACESCMSLQWPNTEQLLEDEWVMHHGNASQFVGYGTLAHIPKVLFRLVPPFAQP